ncbi:MAG: hypothetical protein L3J59_00690 [Methylococcaceae bacterium]|nr:hypothetical protein [Methylococcaceae bacterium]
MRFAPTKASTIKEPGVTIAAARNADSFNFFWRLSILDDLLFSIGYLRAPHDWHRGDSFFSSTPQ